jgi:O-antigen ligase/Flp pilus assembly protein TadD
MTTFISASILFGFIKRGQISIPATILDIPILLFLCFQLISTIFSIDPHISVWGYYGRFNGGLVSTICYILLYYSLIISFKESSSKHTGKTFFKTISTDSINLLMYSFLTSSILVSIYALLQRNGIDAHLWVQDVQNRVFSSLGQPNWLAAYIVPCIILFITLFILSSRFSIIYTLFTLMLYAVLLFTKSRSGFFAFWISNAFFVIILMIKHSLITKRITIITVIIDAFYIKSLPLRNLVILNILLVLITIIISSPINMPWINQQSTSVAVNQTETALSDISFNTTVTDSGDIRKIVWTGAWNAAISKPLTGWGVETFAWIYYRFKPIAHNLTSEWDFLYNKAHNEYLNYAATTGFIGLGTYLLFIVVFLFYLSKELINKPLSKQYIFTLGLGVGWISLLITNFFGFSVVVTSLLFWLIPASILVLNTSVSITRFEKQRISKYSAILYVIIGIATLYITSSISLYWTADVNFAKAIAAGKQDKYQTSYTHVSNAIALRPNEPMYINELSETSSVLAYAYHEQEDASVSARFVEQAIQASDQTLAISPFNVSFWKTRTRVFYNLSQIDPAYLEKALESIETAEKLAPTDPKITYNKAIILGGLDRKDDAITSLEKSISMKPNYRDAAWALSLFYEEDKNIEKRNEWLEYILKNINPDDSEVKDKLKN